MTFAVFFNSEGFDFNPFHEDLRGQGGAARGLQPRALILEFLMLHISM
jgi:hypothetical protein